LERNFIYCTAQAAMAKRVIWVFQAQKNLKITSLDFHGIKTILTNGKNAMPAFKTILGSQGNIDSVAIYVTTLQH